MVAIKRKPPRSTTPTTTTTIDPSLSCDDLFGPLPKVRDDCDTEVNLIIGLQQDNVKNLQTLVHDFQNLQFNSQEFENVDVNEFKKNKDLVDMFDQASSISAKSREGVMMLRKGMCDGGSVADFARQVATEVSKSDFSGAIESYLVSNDQISSRTVMFEPGPLEMQVNMNDDRGPGSGIVKKVKPGSHGAKEGIAPGARIVKIDPGQDDEQAFTGDALRQKTKGSAAYGLKLQLTRALTSSTMKKSFTSFRTTPFSILMAYTTGFVELQRLAGKKECTTSTEGLAKASATVHQIVDKLDAQLASSGKGA